VWRLEDFITDVNLTSCYSRKDFYKITLCTGHATYHYADQRLLQLPGQYTLLFTNTQVPYSWELHDGQCQGYCCVFTEDFLPAHAYQRPADWAVFDPAGQSFFPLSPAQVETFSILFRKMLAEQESDYTHKHELLFHYVMECVHGAMKLAPVAEPHGATAATRLADSFRTLLARQFPVITQGHRLALRTPQAFADQLAVHVNYLSRTLKAVTGKTTSQLLAERLVQEARTLLLHTDWSIAQIGYCLGFEEPTRFTEFFRKHTHFTPSQVRQV
jgi:AraC-like DNA-binding protein